MATYHCCSRFCQLQNALEKKWSNLMERNKGLAVHGASVSVAIKGKPTSSLSDLYMSMATTIGDTLLCIAVPEQSGDTDVVCETPNEQTIMSMSC